MAQAAQGVVGSLSLKVSKKWGDVELRDAVRRHGGGGLMVGLGNPRGLFQL